MVKSKHEPVEINRSPPVSDFYLPVVFLVFLTAINRLTIVPRMFRNVRYAYYPMYPRAFSM